MIENKLPAGKTIPEIRVLTGYNPNKFVTLRKKVNKSDNVSKEFNMEIGMSFKAKEKAFLQQFTGIFKEVEVNE